MLVTLVLFLAGLEAAARLGARVLHRQRGLRFDAELGWHMRPGLVKVGPTWSADEPARTNSAGLRDAEHGRAAPAGTFRIAALGDSFVYGAGVDYGQRFSELLEHEPGLEVVNFGHSAYGTDQELRQLEVEALDYCPDLVLLVAFLDNDLTDIAYERRFGWPRPHYQLAGGRLRLVRPRLTWDVRLRTESYLAELVLARLGGLAPRSVLAPSWRGRDTLPLFTALVERMQELCSARGIPFLVVLAHSRERVLDPLPVDLRARQALEAAGLAVIDTAPRFAAALSAGEDLFAPCGHWSPRGHELVAAVIRARLRREGWLP